MDAIGIIDPQTGKAHEVPFSQLPAALQAGGQFADDSQKQKAIALQSKESFVSPIAVERGDSESDDTSQFEQEAEPDRGVIGNVFSAGSDVASSFANALKRGAKFAADTPEMMEDFGQELLEHPGKAQLRGIGQIGAEAAEIGKGIVNLPYNLNQYLARKHLLPQLIGKLGKFIPHIPEDTGLEKAIGLTPNKKSDRLMRGLTEGAGLVAGGVPLAKGVKNLATAPSKQRAFKRALESKIEQAEAEKGLASGELDTLKEALRDEYSKVHGERVGDLSPIGQQEQINIKRQKLEANPKKNEIPEGELPSIPEKPDTKSMLEEHKNAIENAKDEAEKGLELLGNPAIKAGGRIKKAIEDVKSTASDLYDNARNHYKDKKIVADNSAEIKAATKELEAMKDADELAPGYGSGTAEQKGLQEKIDALKAEKVNASDIFDLQRTLETMAEKTRSKQYAGKVPELEFKRLNNIAERLESHADKLAKRLESVGGKDIQKIMTEANKGWRTYKQLIKENPVGKASMKGSVPNQALIRLAEDYPANDFLKGLVDSDAELRKHLLSAYSGEKNVNKLLKPSTVIDKYIKSLPEVEEKLNAFKNAISDYRAGEKEAVKINQAHDDLVKSMKDVAEAKQLQEQIKFHQEAIPKIKAKMAKVDAKSAEHAKLAKELKMHQQHLADRNYRLKKYGRYVVGYLVGNEVAKKVGL